MVESHCYRCGEEVEPSFDICWNCGSTLRGASPIAPVVEVVPEVAPPLVPAQFNLRHLFFWTTVVAVLSGTATSVFGPFVAT